MFSRFFQKRALSAPAKSGLRPTLGIFDVTGIGLSAIIGAGVFVSFGRRIANGESSGWEMFCSILICATACYFLSLLYAELAAAVGTSGSAYSYIYVALGRLPAFLTGWLLAIEYLLSACIVAATATSYLKFLLPIPSQWSAPPLGDMEGAIFNLPAALLFLICTLALTRTVREASWLNLLMVYIKVGALVILILLGLAFVDWSNLSPTAASITWSNITKSFSAVFFAFIGFDAVASAVDEARNPGKIVPAGIISSLLISALLYGAFVLVLSGMGSPGVISEPNVPSVVKFFQNLPGGMNWLEKPMYCVVLLALVSTVLSVLYCQTRIFLTMSKDRLFPAVFSRVHKKSGVPVWNTLITGIVGSLIAGFISETDTLWDFISLSTLLIFVLITCSVLVLRKSHPTLNRPFRVRYIWPIAVLAIGFIGLLVINIPMFVWTLLFAYLGLGTIVYLLLARKRAAGPETNE